MIDFFGFHSKASAPAEGEMLSVFQNKTLTLEVTGDAEGLKITPEAMVDAKSEDWQPLSAIALNKFKIANPITANGIYALDVTGLYKIRFNITAISSGEATVVGRISMGA